MVVQQTDERTPKRKGGSYETRESNGRELKTSGVLELSTL